MNAINAASVPELAPPGAGLPKIELWIARLLFARARRKLNRDAVNASFQAERKKIADIVRQRDENALSVRVLIPRVPGMEDSSRHWSVLMTLDHLRIIHIGITRTIKSLAAGITPSGMASTANVKPRADVTVSVIPEYEQSCDQLLATVADIPELRTRARFTHPWFGPLDVAGWHTLSATHLAIHRTQIERIREGLRNNL